ncbi:unnamed protein product [Victoria cruziana]
MHTAWLIRTAWPLQFSGKTIGIVGLGRIGMAIAKRSEAFGCTVIYHSRSEKPGADYRFCSSIVDLAADSNILVLACSLTEETRHIVNQTVINALGPEGFIVNIGRGSLIDEPELVKALLEKRLGGAGLDVFEWEPDPPEELFDLDNVVLLPHVGSSTVGTAKDMADLVVKNLEAHASGRPLLTPVL